MNVKTSTMIREACAEITRRGVKIHKGAWFEWNGTEIVGTDPIGAVLLVHNAMPEGLDPLTPATLVRPGLLKAACKVLDVDGFWLYRFFMGFDRNFLIKRVDDNDVETKDEVSEWGIALARELFR